MTTVATHCAAIGRAVMASLLVFVLALTLVATPASAVEPDEVLDDPALEARALEIGRNLRCVVCQSQSIDDSNAPLAKDMRLVVRERLVAGDTDAQVYAYLVERYGDYVLLRPPVQPNTYLLWIAPLFFLAVATGGAVAYVRAHRADDDDPVNDADDPDTDLPPGPTERTA